MIQSKFLPDSQSAKNTPFSVADIHPALFLTFTALINQEKFANIAWRKATGSTSQTKPTSDKNGHNTNHFYARGLLTGSPAFKELKNLVVAIILSSNKRIKPQ